MKIKFKNGYSVEINDSYLKTMSKQEIYNKAKKIVDRMVKDADNDGPVIIVKKVKTPNGFKVVVIKNDTITGIKRFNSDCEEEAQDFYDRLADKYNLDEEGYENYGNTKIAATAKYFNEQLQDSVSRIKDKSVKNYVSYKYKSDDGKIHGITFTPSKNSPDECNVLIDYNPDTKKCKKIIKGIPNHRSALKILENTVGTVHAMDSKEVKDAPIEFTEELGFAVTPTTIKKFVSKKDGHILDPRAFTKALGYLETDLDYDIDVKGPKWADPDNMVTDPRMVNKIMKRYDEFVAELDKIDDDDFNDKVQEIIDKVDVLKQVVYGIDDTGPDVSSEEDDFDEEIIEEAKEEPVIEEPVKEVVKKTVEKTVKPAPKKEAPVEEVVEEKIEETPVIKLSGNKKEIPLNEEEDDFGFEDVNIEDGCKDEACSDEDIDDVYIEDVPLGGATIHASVEGAPDHEFNKSVIVRGNSRALAEDKKEAEYGRRLLMGEFDDVKETLKYDKSHAGDVVAVTPKYLLHMGMEKYKEIIDLFNVPGLEDKYKELLKLYNDLFYNGYYLGVR